MGGPLRKLDEKIRGTRGGDAKGERDRKKREEERKGRKEEKKKL
jgi:hypothetical protein